MFILVDSYSTKIVDRALVLSILVHESRSSTDHQLDQVALELLLLLSKFEDSSKCIQASFDS